jgi:hypothetical protein
MKLLLENGANVREGLAIVGSDLVDHLDFSRLQRAPTTFVVRDYRHVAADVVLTVPFRSRKDRPEWKQLWIYLLIEHQSEPDELMPLRLADYEIQIFKHQVRVWQQKHRRREPVRLQPVLPVVFYTGTRRWDKLGKLTDLVEGGALLGRFVPVMDALFLNLPDTPAEQLETRGGYFGRLLRLVQRRKARLDEFHALLSEGVAHLEALRESDRDRWLDLLSYLNALVYHDRAATEWTGLHETIEASVQNDEHRKEVFDMRQSMAEVLIAKGKKEGRKEERRKNQEKVEKVRKEEAVRARQQLLLLLMRERFREIPSAVVSAIEAATDIEQIDKWAARFATAKTLAEVGITAAK